MEELGDNGGDGPAEGGGLGVVEVLDEHDGCRGPSDGAEEEEGGGKDVAADAGDVGAGYGEGLAAEKGDDDAEGDPNGDEDDRPPAGDNVLRTEDDEERENEHDDEDDEEAAEARRFLFFRAGKDVGKDDLHGERGHVGDCLNTRFTLEIVDSPLFLIGEDLVRVIDSLHGLIIARVSLVRVMLPRQSEVCLLDFSRRRILLDPQDRVEVL